MANPVSVRTERFLVEELDGEVLLYDLDRHEAHCLNETAGIVWRACDGTRSVAELAALLPASLEQPAAEEVVRSTLHELGQLGLLVQPAGIERVLSRRVFVQRFGLAAAATLPLVTSLVAPEPSAAASCGGAGAPCAVNADCCSNNCVTLVGTCV